MGSAIAGLVLVVVAVVVWLGHLTVDHALAILIGIIGVLLVLFGYLPGTYFRRRP
jgi:hypothetical protein